jgi:hypothetical protein
MKEMFEYLDKIACMNPTNIKKKLRSKYNLSENITQKVYITWKKEFMKYGYKGCR